MLALIVFGCQLKCKGILIVSISQNRQPEILCELPGIVIEQDCACGNNDASISFDRVFFEKHINTWHKSHFLYRQKMNKHNNLFFAIFGGSSPVVLNKSAIDILELFSTPTSIQDAIASISDVDRDRAEIIIQHMIMLGLISSPDYVKPTKQAPKTLTAWLHVTNECNLRCDYCYITKTPDKMDVEQGRQSVDAVFRSAIANGFQSVKLKFAGGESTMNFSLLLELFDYARSQALEKGLGLAGVVLTNGVGITERMIDALQERKIKLSISLDGVGEYHDAQRKFINGKGSFHLVERSLDRLAARGLAPSITITVSNRNLEGLPQVVDFVLQRNLPFTINFYRENECSTGHVDLAYNDEKIIEAMKKAFAVIENNLPPHSLLGSLVDRARLDAPHSKPCGVGDSYLVIDQNGKVAKCHMEIERSITDVSMPDPLKLIQLDQIGIQNVSVEEKEGCRDCTWRYWCAGGCPALTYRVTGRYDIKSPNCHIYKALFPEVLRLEGLRLLKYQKNSSLT